HRTERGLVEECLCVCQVSQRFRIGRVRPDGSIKSLGGKLALAYLQERHAEPVQLQLARIIHRLCQRPGERLELRLRVAKRYGPVQRSAGSFGVVKRLEHREAHEHIRLDSVEPGQFLKRQPRHLELPRVEIRSGERLNTRLADGACCPRLLPHSERLLVLPLPVVGDAPPEHLLGGERSPGGQLVEQRIRLYVAPGLKLRTRRRREVPVNPGLISRRNAEQGRRLAAISGAQHRPALPHRLDEAARHRAEPEQQHDRTRNAQPERNTGDQRPPAGCSCCVHGLIMAHLRRAVQMQTLSLTPAPYSYYTSGDALSYGSLGLPLARSTHPHSRWHVQVRAPPKSREGCLQRSS